jgi:PIN domain nuclease of toxin-antitoxin system
MRILLDTQVWLWMIETPGRLSQAARRLVSATDTDRYLSAATAWEIAIKYRLGKLKLSRDPAALLPEWMDRTATSALPVMHRHALHTATLPLHHRDPFDRLLIAQAQLEDLTVVTSDEDFERYDVTVKRA